MRELIREFPKMLFPMATLYYLLKLFRKLAITIRSSCNSKRGKKVRQQVKFLPTSKAGEWINPVEKPTS
jgi:hypothetical protein